MNVKVAVLSGVVAFCTSHIGTRIALSINPMVLKAIMLVALPFAGLIILFKKDFGGKDESSNIPKQKKIILALVMGTLIGFYDGIFGPGTGTFAIIGYTALMKYDVKTAVGNSKLLNLFSNYSSLILGIVSGKVIYSIAIPAAICGIMGNYIGSSLAIKNGKKIIKPMMIVVVFLLFINLFYNLVIYFV